MDIDIVLDDEDAELAELRAQQDAMSAVRPCPLHQDMP